MARDIAFLHGGNHGSWCWKPTIDALRAAGYEGAILSLDMPGCGTRRAEPGDDMTIADVAALLVADVRAAGLDRPVLIGHSIAGVVLPHMGSQAPDLFSELCYLTAAMPRIGQPVSQMMGSGLHGENPEVVGWPLDPAAHAMEDVLRAMFTPDLGPDLAAWLMEETAQDSHPPCMSHEAVSLSTCPGVPVSYVVTLRDPILPPGWQGRFAERVGASRLFHIDTPHEPMVSHPELLAEFIHTRIAMSGMD